MPLETMGVVCIKFPQVRWRYGPSTASCYIIRRLLVSPRLDQDRTMERPWFPKKA